MTEVYPKFRYAICSENDRIDTFGELGGDIFVGTFEKDLQEAFPRWRHFLPRACATNSTPPSPNTALIEILPKPKELASVAHCLESNFLGTFCQTLSFW